MKKLILFSLLILSVLLVNAQSGAYWKNTYGTSIYLNEQSAAKGDIPAFGQFWIKTATPNQAWFTDDTGKDMLLGDHSFGAISFDTTAVTAIATINVPLKAGGITNSIALVNFDLNAVNNRLRYTGNYTRYFTVTFTGSTTNAANAKQFTLSIAKNGTVLPQSNVIRTIATGADYTAIAIQAVVSLTTNDYVEVFMTNNTDATDATIQEGILTVR